MSVTSEFELWPDVTLADALAVTAEETGRVVTATTTITGVFGEGTGRGVGGKRGGGSTHIGVGDSPLQEGSCDEMVEVLGGVRGSEVGVLSMTMTG